MTKEEAINAWKCMRSEIDNENWLFVGTINPQMVDMAIEALSADAVQVVRCKDCKHYLIDGLTATTGWCYENKNSVHEADYCSYGERKGGKDE